MDGAFSLSGDKHGIGFVARDSSGKFILVGSKTIWFEGSADMVEAKAILWALSKAKEFGLLHVMIKSNCKIVVEALNGRGQRVAHVQTVIDNCLMFCLEFLLLSFLFCFRTCNGVAHKLAI